ncbi:hypothetical protein CVT26_001088 [Gymnopilus dilepis]|uniref:Uncharacterized protein n=1 Tax=Gymnopilus dilepis TaxID=231916 RepID=A0A409X3J4_9AGAR|nr:hypothetical protein CVT26_001088 [Gymnopilus dilepis]
MSWYVPAGPPLPEVSHPIQKEPTYKDERRVKCTRWKEGRTVKMQLYDVPFDYSQAALMRFRFWIAQTESSSGTDTNLVADGIARTEFKTDFSRLIASKRTLPSLESNYYHALRDAKWD